MMVAVHFKEAEMKQGTDLDRETVRMIHEQLREAVEDVLAQHGLALTNHSVSFLPTSCSFRFEGAVKATDGTVLSRAASEFARLGHRYGVKAEDLGRIITLGTTEYKLTGLKPSRPKFPFEAERVHDGKKFKLMKSSVVAALCGSQSARVVEREREFG